MELLLSPTASSPAPSPETPWEAGSGISQAASREEGRARRFLRQDAQRGPLPSRQGLPGRARFSGELLPRERTELPRGGGAPAPARPTGELWVRTPSGWR